MNDLNSRFWKVMAVLLVLSIFFLGYSILNGGAGRGVILPQKAFADGTLAPGGGYFAETLGTNTQDAAIFIWKYDANGVPVSVSMAYRQKDWMSNTYEIKPEEKNNERRPGYLMPKIPFGNNVTTPNLEWQRIIISLPLLRKMAGIPTIKDNTDLELVAEGSPALVKIRPFERESWLKKLGHRILKEKWSHGRTDQTQTAAPAK